MDFRDVSNGFLAVKLDGAQANGLGNLQNIVGGGIHEDADNLGERAFSRPLTGQRMAG